MLSYRLLLSCLSPLFAVAFLLQILRGRERLSDLAERFGARMPWLSPERPCIWLHGASNGELTGARALIEEALRRDPELLILITVNTLNARHMVRDWSLPRAIVRLAPVDLRWVLNRFIRKAHPAALVTIENEIWPNRFAALAQHGVPIFVAGARMSERTAKSWVRLQKMLGGAMQTTIRAITRLAAQDMASEQRLLQLGLPSEALLPRMNLKSTVEMEVPTAQDIAAYQRLFPRDQCFLAASTHAGEDQIVLAAFAQLRQRHPHLRLILAPRHPARADTIGAEIRAAGLTLAQRSKGESPDTGAVYLADTLGEMPLWYSVAAISVIGGSFSDLGGHTPFEPAQCGTAILHGPHVWNHAAAYRALDAADAAWRVTDSGTLAEAVDALLSDTPKATEMAQRAETALTALREKAIRQEGFWIALAKVPQLKALG